jgi:uncharacterized protein YgfB (UPF0149 family)
MSSPVLFADVELAMAAAGSTVSAAEAHGCLCGALCVRAHYRVADWIEELLPESPGADEHPDAHETLLAIYSQTVAALEGTQMEFSPLLPNDDDALTERVAALSAWCQGFLYGFGAAASVPGLRLSADLDEALRDFAEISRGGAVGAESEQIEEEAYAQLVEYLRAAAQLVYDELEPRRHAEASAVS